LRRAGVPVTARRFGGQMHGFFTMIGLLPGSAAAIEFVTEQLTRQLRTASEG
jgi:acetyl esterase